VEYPKTFYGDIIGRCTPKDGSKTREIFTKADDLMVKSLGIAAINEQMEARNVLVSITSVFNNTIPRESKSVPEKFTKGDGIIVTVAGADSGKKTDEAIRRAVQGALRTATNDIKNDIQCEILTRTGHPPGILPSGDYIEAACTGYYKMIDPFVTNGIFNDQFRRSRAVFGDGIKVSITPSSLNYFGTIGDDIENHAKKMSDICK
jgi:hypothetical protein